MARRIAAHWTRLALADAPSARSSHKISAIGGRGYLFGGEAVARQSIDSTVHCLDPTAGTWTRPAAAYGGGAPAAAPQPRVGHAQAAVSGKLLVFGGRTGEEMGEAALDDLWQWDPVSALWEPLDAAGGGAPPSPRSYHAATAIGESLYVFGGCGAEGRLADLHHFDASTRRWEELPPPPADVAGRGGATLEPAPKGDALWLVAGFAGHETNDLLRYCTKTRAWERKPSGWLRPRSVCASMAMPDALLLFGGEVSPSDRGHAGAGGFAGDLLAIDPLDGEPQELSVVAPAEAALRELKWQAQQLRSQMTAAAAEEDFDQAARLKTRLQAAQAALETAQGQTAHTAVPAAAAEAAAEAAQAEEAPRARGWAAAAALSDREGVVFGGLAGSDAEPERLGDAWRVRLEVEYFGTDDYI